MIKFLLLIISILVHTKYSFVSPRTSFSCKQSVYGNSNLLLHYTQQLTIISTSNARSYRDKSNLVLNFGFFWDDDLPNLFGINPVEATIIFGILYYIYGPEELYDNAREAGKLFSTYAPVVKDVVFNIYNEFKDYIDEDKQRDEMKKRGIDISKIPRRTTNLIERVQESLNMLSEMTEQKGGMSEEIQSGLRTELFETTKDNNESVERSKKTNNRMKKKDILKAKNINVDKIINSENQGKENNIQNEIDRSFNLVQEKLNSLTTARQIEINDKGLFSTPFASASTSDFNDFNGDTNNDIDDMGTAMRSLTNRTNSLSPRPSTDHYPFPDTTSEMPPLQPPKGDSGMSKFQQQLSGTWNQNVLEKEKVLGTSAAFQVSTSDYDSNWTDWEDPNNFIRDTTTNATPNQLLSIATPSIESAAYDEYIMPPNVAAPLMPQPVLTTASAHESGVSYSKEDLSSDSLTTPQMQAPHNAELESPLKLPLPTSEVSTAVVSILAELDRDYLSLRQRMIDSMLKLGQITQESPTQLTFSKDITTNADNVSKLSSYNENANIASALPAAVPTSDTMHNTAEVRPHSIEQRNLTGLLSTTSRFQSNDSLLSPLQSRTSTCLNQSMLKTSIRRKYWPRTLEVD